MGLPGAVVFNADAVRADLSRDLGFSHEARIEHAHRIDRFMSKARALVNGNGIAAIVMMAKLEGELDDALMRNVFERRSAKGRDAVPE